MIILIPYYLLSPLYPLCKTILLSNHTPPILIFFFLEPLSFMFACMIMSGGYSLEQR